VLCIVASTVSVDNVHRSQGSSVPSGSNSLHHRRRSLLLLLLLLLAPRYVIDRRRSHHSFRYARLTAKTATVKKVTEKRQRKKAARDNWATGKFGNKK